jgi:FkbM family methyltransferase
MNVAIDVGGYQGQYLYYFDQMNCDKIICIEPSELYFSVCSKIAELVDTETILVNKALYKKGDYFLSNDVDGSNIFSADPQSDEQVRGISFADLVKEHELSHVKYIKLNCEGCEFTILEDILEMNFDVDEFLVQFHENDEHRNSLLKQFSERGYDIYTHQRFESDNYVWWSIVKKDMKRTLDNPASNIVKPFSP